VVVVLPALAAVLGRSVKSTIGPPVTITLSDSVALAFRTTVPPFEFFWALRGAEIAAESAIPPISARDL
jgi:hypothetical protein